MPIRQQPPAVPTPPPTEASVIIPFGGADRLPLLETTLTALRRCRAVGQVILVEMDATPQAADIASRLADIYLFATEGADDSRPFHKTRAMNLGLPFVTASHFLWLDADVLLAEGFVEQALGECHERDLDCLIPWSAIHFLGEADTAAVCRGETAAAACRSTTMLAPRSGARGAVVAVRTAFARHNGGAFDGFRGWGGEDTAWFVKVQMLGRAALTQHRDRPVWHLFHPQSVGYVPRERLADHPCHAGNVDLLRQARSFRTPAAFLRAFPTPGRFFAPWEGSRRVACTAAAAALGKRLVETYGAAVCLVAPDEAADLHLDCRRAPDTASDAMQELRPAAARLAEAS